MSERDSMVEPLEDQRQASEPVDQPASEAIDSDDFDIYEYIDATAKAAAAAAKAATSDADAASDADALDPSDADLDHTPTEEQLYDDPDDEIDDPEAALAARRADYLSWLQGMPTAKADAQVLGILVARLIRIDAEWRDTEGLAVLQYLRERLGVPTL